jgi:hypothetical protein
MLTFENKTKAAAKKEEKKCRETLESEKKLVLNEMKMKLYNSLQ